MDRERERQTDIVIAKIETDSEKGREKQNVKY